MDSMNEWDANSEGATGEGTGALLGDTSAEPAQMPLGMGDGFGQDNVEFDTFSTAKKSNANGALLLLLVIGVGAGTLWAMRMTGSLSTEDQQAKLAEAKIDQALQRLKTEAAGKKGAAGAASPEAITALLQDTDDVLAMFSTDPTDNQVDVDELSKNPFKLFLDKPKKTPEAEADESEIARRQRLEVIRRQAMALDLQSIITGNPSAAVISGEVVRAGDTVGDFSIKTITPYGVEVEAEGEVFTLTMAKDKKSRK